ncbi:hypothetical protein A3K34_03030 [candidate division WWE3 bacterium RIFOXYC1_FULL_40_10]|uniref:GDP-mannose 4,6-dehydratase n=1 Tax=candidate division WWE3 bacterium RIFOXYA2_FULL_46_9 TaxID=1802636 RepID=A0A1F4W085_UNCKA|nr:MAG: hypothetical protein A3K58_03030 [candidate division WWE3 bacterium RIFOXYB1_FULL_40_22]OGC61821.1 MAG: hypothetical protein A3K37_03030 [candidate division WWE3 bacterium RIFOXYA1_FULL_40_11]OGC62839.1 MAG: hypothetical protein A2264_04190 [candidate division WWE3 bacterium RIFOXYA2_FULL_46_9]OGC64293.1 MAG: hypothetical protein A2326_00445 [candidate division WWE3 bacterium RIFOXYB2_FULL_41_6]OGC66204.1 MAG: hypothetical protein A3K34_03030 [candidate division WWE3 bacterium RIFOXYC1_
MSKAIIVGSKGQDGVLLTSLLRGKNYGLLGLDLDYFDETRFEWISKVDILDSAMVAGLIKNTKPDELYYLAAYHHSSQDTAIDGAKLVEKSFDVHVKGYTNFLEAIKQESVHTKVLYASSSLIFGDPSKEMVCEDTPVDPKNPYAITKYSGMQLGKMYRDTQGMFISNVILFNHESVLREEKFVTMKIIKTALEIKRGLETELVLGDLDAEVDWGYAPDYVEAMWRVLQLGVPGDFVVSTGNKHTVRDFVRIVFDYLKLDWQKHVKENNQVLTRRRNPVVGDNTKLRKLTGWTPSVTFEKMIENIIEEKMKI